MAHQLTNRTWPEPKLAATSNNPMEYPCLYLIHLIASPSLSLYHFISLDFNAATAMSDLLMRSTLLNIKILLIIHYS